MNNFVELQQAMTHDLNSLYQTSGLFQTLFRLQGATLNQNNYNQILQGFSSAHNISKERVEVLVRTVFHYLNIKVDLPELTAAETNTQRPEQPAQIAPEQEAPIEKITINKDSYKALHEAIVKGDLQTVMTHMVSGAKIDHKYRGGFTPLLLAAKHHWWDIVEYLIARGADVNAVNNDNFTLLGEVIGENKSNIFETLMHKTLYTNTLELGMSSCVLNLADRSYVDGLQAKGAVLRQALIDFLLKGNNTKFVEYMLKNQLLDRSGLSQSLVEACSKYGKDLALVKKLVQQGADLRCKAKNERNLIIATVYSSGYDVFEYDDESLETDIDDQQIAIIHYLTEQGIDINEPDVVGRTALHYAVGMNHLSLTSFLLRKGSNAQVVDLLGKTPLDYAHEKGYEEVANVLLGAVGQRSSQSTVPQQDSSGLPPDFTGRRKLKLNLDGQD
ncbi:ankyrin repeat domain-containing protein [Paenibacillus sp. UNC451MF]|uniref:ankyrin repeat domain-containing protein n=1 Tax=Paenibacillus sp. UNC451MF TaxID=1449063 RepID=UPI000490F3DA|nr:ankyrin repeat domain-containing protein [Paenibacillus sp. UNC451MF]